MATRRPAAAATARRRPIPGDFLTWDVSPYLDPADRPPTGWSFPASWWRAALAAQRWTADARAWARTNGWSMREIHAARRARWPVVTPAEVAADTTGTDGL